MGLAGQSVSPSPRLRIGFLGVGHSHAAEKIEVVRVSADWELVGFCEEDAELQAKYTQAGLARLSAEELLRRSQVVVVESNVPDHARHAKLALSALKHVHLEKPPAETLDAFRELVTLARQKNLLLQMGYMAIFEFARAVGIVSSSTLQPHAGPHRSLEIFGTNGSAVVNPIEPPALAIDLAKPAGPYRAGLNSVPMPTYRRYVADFADLAAKIREGQKLAVSPNEDLLVQETLIRACTISSTCSHVRTEVP